MNNGDYMDKKITLEEITKNSQTINDEIEYVHEIKCNYDDSNKYRKSLVRDYDLIYDFLSSISSSYIDALAFLIDYGKMQYEGKIDKDFYYASVNDMYLLCLIEEGYRAEASELRDKVEVLEKKELDNDYPDYTMEGFEE